jgi:hypothetical protein
MEGMDAVAAKEKQKEAHQTRQKGMAAGKEVPLWHFIPGYWKAKGTQRKRECWKLRMGEYSILREKRKLCTYSSMN